jgi:hypothetical protein
MMRRFTTMSVAIAGLLVVLAAPANLVAATCTDRQLVCFDYCARHYSNAPRCLDECKRLLSQCVATGCWESKVTASRCGFDRR